MTTEEMRERKFVIDVISISSTKRFGVERSNLKCIKMVELTCKLGQLE